MFPLFEQHVSTDSAKFQAQSDSTANATVKFSSWLDSSSIFMTAYFVRKREQRVLVSQFLLFVGADCHETTNSVSGSAYFSLIRTGHPVLLRRAKQRHKTALQNAIPCSNIVFNAFFAKYSRSFTSQLQVLQC